MSDVDQLLGYGDEEKAHRTWRQGILLKYFPVALFQVTGDPRHSIAMFEHSTYSCDAPYSYIINLSGLEKRATHSPGPSLRMLS